MPTVTTTFSSDSASTERALVKLQSEYEKLKDKIAAVGKASKESSKNADEGFGAAGVAELKNYAAGMLSIGAAIGFVTSSMQEWRNVQKEIAQGQLDLERNAAAESFKSGGSVAGMGQIPLGRQQASELLGIVRGDAPDLSDPRAVAIAAEAAKLVRTAVGMGGAHDVASFAGQLGEIATGASPDDLLDLSTAMQQSLRGDFGKVQSDGGKRATAALMNAGKTFEQALGIIGAAAKNDIAPKTVEQLVAIASGNPELKQGKALAGGRRAALSPEDEAYNRFVREKSVTGRIDLALNDELVSRGVLGDAGGAKAGMIGRVNIDAETAKYLAAQRDNLAASEVARITKQFPNAGQAATVAVGADAAQAKAAPSATALELAAQVRSAEGSRLDPVSWMFKQVMNTREAFNDSFGVATGKVKPEALAAEAALRAAALQDDGGASLLREYDALSPDVQKQLRRRGDQSYALTEALSRIAVAAERRGTPSIRSRPEAER